MKTHADYRYLIIEDEAPVRDFVASALRKMGATHIDLAENGALALDILDSGKQPDIIICDLYMPQLDGVKFLRHLAMDQFNGGVILMSGSTGSILGMAAKMAETYHLNILGALSKPFTPAALEALLISFAEKQKQSA